MSANGFCCIGATASVLAAPIIEEIALRLLFLSTVAWIAGRFMENRHTISIKLADSSRHRT